MKRLTKSLIATLTVTSILFINASAGTQEQFLSTHKQISYIIGPDMYNKNSINYNSKNILNSYQASLIKLIQSPYGGYYALKGGQKFSHKQIKSGIDLKNKDFELKSDELKNISLRYSFMADKFEIVPIFDENISININNSKVQLSIISLFENDIVKVYDSNSKTNLLASTKVINNDINISFDKPSVEKIYVCVERTFTDGKVYNSELTEIILNGVNHPQEKSVLIPNTDLGSKIINEKEYVTIKNLNIGEKIRFYSETNNSEFVLEKLIESVDSEGMVLLEIPMQLKALGKYFITRIQNGKMESLKTEVKCSPYNVNYSIQNKIITIKVITSDVLRNNDWITGQISNSKGIYFIAQGNIENGKYETYTPIESGTYIIQFNLGGITQYTNTINLP